MNFCKYTLILLTIFFPAYLFSQDSLSVHTNALSLKNLHKIDEGVYRSDQPDVEDFAILKALGIQEVLNLRSWHGDDDEAQNVEIILHRVKMNAHDIDDEDVIQALKIIKNRQGNILIHCKHGADRTGVICAMYRIIFQNWTKEEALDELVNGGFGYHSIFVNIPQYIKEVDLDMIKSQL